MKSWNPSSKSFEAAPPLPEFVGHWQMNEAPRTAGASSLSGLARAALGRVRSAIGVLLGFERAVASDRGESGQATPLDAGIISYSGPGESDRIVLPMSSGASIRPGESAVITTRPQNVAFRPERIIIGGHPNHWVVNDIKIGRRTQLVDNGDLPGVAFSADAQDARVCFDVVNTSVKFTMIVTYIGPNPDGEPFTCAALGSSGCWTDSNTTEVESNRIYLPLSSGVNILPGTSAQIKADPQDPFRAERIIIGGNPDAWIVNDIKVGNRSQLSQSGDVPGEAFAATAREAHVSFETAQVAMNFTICVTYVGKKEGGEPFLACAIGTVPA